MLAGFLMFSENAWYIFSTKLSISNTNESPLLRIRVDCTNGGTFDPKMLSNGIHLFHV